MGTPSMEQTVRWTNVHRRLRCPRRRGLRSSWTTMRVRQSLRLCLEAAGARVLGVATGGAALEVEPCQGQKDGLGKAVLGVVPVAEMKKRKKPFPTRMRMVPPPAAVPTEQDV